MKLSEKIKSYRKSFDLTQEELAEKLNVSRQVITKWESELGMPEVSNLKALAELFNVSVDFLLDDEQEIEYPIFKVKYELEKNNYSNRYDYAVNYLKDKYSNDEIYVLTQIENGERSFLTKVFSFITICVSDVSSIIEWFKDLAIWFVVENSKRKLLIKVTKEYIETRELSSLINTDKFTYDKNKFIKVDKI